MERKGSKHIAPKLLLPGKSGASGQNCSVSGATELLPPDSEFRAALGVIMSAFVDLGFGVSAIQQARRTANADRQIKTLVEAFHRDAA